jgi:NAD:arginine ADP-ribosyltransferase
MASKYTDYESKSKSTQRFEDVSDEPRRMLAPIKGYEKMPLVSLEDSVEPIVSEIPDVKHMVWTVKQNCKDPADHLTADESGSIMLYTLEWTSREESFYYKLNGALRALDRNKLRPWFLYLKLLIFSLAKLPNCLDNVFRGVKEDLHKQYPNGSTFVWWGFSSCTANVKVLQSEEFLGKTGERTMFNIKCSSGRNIQKHSFFGTENEVLLLPARQFEVIGLLDSGNGLRIIQIQEIKPQFELLASVIKNAI